MQPTQNQDATYLPKNSVDRSLIWLILGAVGMCFLLLMLISREPSAKRNDESYLSHRADEVLDDDRPTSNEADADLGVR